MSKHFFAVPISCLCIISNTLSYGPCPKADEIVEQHLMLCTDGSIKFCSFCYGGGEEYQPAEELNTVSDPSRIQKLMGEVKRCFDRDREEVWVTDTGEWSLLLTNQNGEEKRFSGSLCTCSGELCVLSDLFRRILNLPQLFVFDGRSAEDRLERLTLDCHCGGENPFEEHYSLDRFSGMIQITQSGPNGFHSVCSYTSPDEISQILDSLTFCDSLRENRSGTESAGLTSLYRLTGVFLQSGVRSSSGEFEASAPPEVWQIISKKIRHFLDEHKTTLL